MGDKVHSIYSLQMGDGPVFYIGRTTEPTQRLWRHRSGQAGMDDLASVIQVDPKSLKLVVLEEVTEKPRAAELKWVEYFRERGFELLNKQLPASGKGEIEYTPELVASIRERAANFERQNKIADELGVHDSEINKITSGRLFPDWPGPIRGKDYF